MNTGYQGHVAGKHPDSDLRYAYDEPVKFEYAVAPYLGFETYVNIITLSPLGAPPYIEAGSVAASAAIIRIPPFGHSVTDAPGTIFTFVGIDIDYRINAAADQLLVRLLRKQKGTFDAPSIVDSWTDAGELTVATGTWTHFTDDTPTHEFDFESYIYYIDIQIVPDAAASDVRISDIVLRVTKKAVE